MCTDNRFELIEEFKKKLIESTNIETSPEEMKVIDNILFRFWQMGWLESIYRMPLVKESAKTLVRSVGDSASAKAFRNAGRFIQNAIDGEAPEFEKIPSAESRKKGEWIEIKYTFHHKCSNCEWINNADSGYDFCPHCGCQMSEGEQE